MAKPYYVYIRIFVFFTLIFASCVMLFADFECGKHEYLFGVAEIPIIT